MALAVKHYTVSAAAGAATDSNIKELSSIQVRESNGTPGVATVLIHEGASGGTVRVPIELAANESQVITFDHPLVASTGTGTWWNEINAGTADVTLSGRA